MNEAPRWHSLVNGTEAQVEALTSGKPLTVVSAGAGTGKTQTLAQRFAWPVSYTHLASTGRR